MQGGRHGALHMCTLHMHTHTPARTHTLALAHQGSRALGDLQQKWPLPSCGQVPGGGMGQGTRPRPGDMSGGGRAGSLPQQYHYRFGAVPSGSCLTVLQLRLVPTPRAARPANRQAQGAAGPPGAWGTAAWSPRHGLSSTGMRWLRGQAPSQPCQLTARVGAVSVQGL